MDAQSAKKRDDIEYEAKLTELERLKRELANAVKRREEMGIKTDAINDGEPNTKQNEGGVLFGLSKIAPANQSSFHTIGIERITAQNYPVN